MESYYSTQIEEIAKWQNEKPGILSQAANKALLPLTWFINRIIPNKAIEGALLACNVMAELMADTGDIKRDANVNDISELESKDLKLSDKLANEIHNWATSVAAIEGGAAGCVGLPGLIADVPALITQSLRVIHKIGLCYGFECKTEQDKKLIYTIMSVAGSNTVKEKAVAVALLQNMGVMIAKNTWKNLAAKAIENKLGPAAAIMAIKALAKQVGINITKRKALQAIPVIGLGVGAAMNAAFINDIAWAARRTFQEHWLLKNGIIDKPINK